MASEWHNQGQSTVGALVRHPVFAPLIAAWFAILLGAAILVQPASSIARITAAVELTAFGDFARIGLALIAALLGGTLGWFGAKALQPRRRFEDEEIEDEAHTRVRPIVASEDLGINSFDDPVDQNAWKDWSEEDIDEEELEGVNAFADFEDIDDDAWVEAEDAEPNADSDLLELTDIAEEHDIVPELPEEPEDAVAESESDDVAAESNLPVFARRIQAGSAIEKLRELPTEQLSLVQMVERFAAALHEHQEQHGKNAPPQEDAALAEGLRALALLSGENPMSSASEPTGEDAPQTHAELRDALDKLRELSGVA